MTTDHIPDATKMVPEALRLANHLEHFRSFPDDLAAAAELRRLHAEIEATDRQVEILSDELSKCSKENEALRAVLQALLDDYDGCDCPPTDPWCPKNRAIAALARAGGKT